MKDHTLTRRDFLRDLGILGGGALMLTSPWLSAFADVTHTSQEKCRVAVIGPGSRGRFLLNFLVQNPKVEVVGLCDIYQPSLDEAHKIAPHAIMYKDYRYMLERSDVQAIVVAVPLHMHYRIVMDVLDAGRDVFCEKTIGYDMQQTYEMYQKHRSTGKIFFSGQQRLFDPRYIQAMKMIHDGTFGDINAIRTFWYRNNDWRRPVPWHTTEPFINWRLYSEYSKGLMTELACHQLQIGSWAMREIPDKVNGHGAITFWKDGREVYDNVHCMYLFQNGVKMTFDSVISNKFYGLEEQIMGHLGTVEPEKGKYYFENIDPAPAFLQLVNEWENKLFDTLPFAGTSWAPETANVNNGHYITGERPKTDGTSLLLEAFIEAVITRKQPANIAEEGYYASQMALLGHEALVQERTLTFPDEYKLDYLNHQSLKTKEEQA
ncbi:MAG: Gfo/Idh/MocA family oxidoreductase [Bacteroides sp.]|nr:Gfo/Idh/MocA family oxidoreductase [Bacteroides sp.]